VHRTLSEFGGGVGRVSSEDMTISHGANRHEMSRSPRSHFRKKRTDEAERRSQIGRNKRVEILERRFLESRDGEDTGIVDHDVGRTAELLPDSIDGGVSRSVIDDIALNRERLAAGSLRNRIEQIDAARKQSDAHAD
jgi:hypothetical protein